MGPAEFVPVVPLASAASWQIFSCRLSKELNVKSMRAASSVSAYPTRELFFLILLLLWKNARASSRSCFKSSSCRESEVIGEGCTVQEFLNVRGDSRIN